MIADSVRIIEIEVEEKERLTLGEIIQRACKEYVRLGVGNAVDDEDFFANSYHEKNHELQVELVEINYISSDKHYTAVEVTLVYFFKIGISTRFTRW